jgi:two-component system cell cycle response regulator
MAGSPSAPCTSLAAGDFPELATAVVGSQPKQIRSATNRLACLVQIYPADAGIGRRVSLEGPIVIGRDPGCEIHLDDAAVSRYHARIVPRQDGCYVGDLRSTNGTFVNNESVLVRKLGDGDYLRVGSHIFRFLAGGNIEADYHEEIFRLAITDALTNVPNRRHLLDFLDRELSRSFRHQRPLALVLLDIDHFKAVNDEHGHLAGDLVLRELAARLRDDIRRHELLARYGGEEFGIALPETSPEGAGQLAERLRELVAGRSFNYKGRPLSVTISLGVASTTGEGYLTPLDFIERADEKLYQAKRQGRNCVVA